MRSAHTLSEAVLTRIRTILEANERKQISLETELDPTLLGGVQIQLDHRVIDGSITRQLQELKEQLTTVNVNL